MRTFIADRFLLFCVAVLHTMLTVGPRQAKGLCYNLDSFQPQQVTRKQNWLTLLLHHLP